MNAPPLTRREKVCEGASVDVAVFEPGGRGSKWMEKREFDAYVNRREKDK